MEFLLTRTIVKQVKIEAESVNEARQFMSDNCEWNIVSWTDDLARIGEPIFKPSTDFKERDDGMPF